MRTIIAPIATVLLLATPAFAQTAPNAVTISSTVQAVKDVTDAKGVKKRILVDPTSVIPGTPLVIWVTYKNMSAKPVTSFVINNPVNKSLDFTGFGDNSGWATVSVDGGKTFGSLATLKVTKADKSIRLAIPADVTNVRWSFAKPIAPNVGGVLSFYGVVK